MKMHNFKRQNGIGLLELMLSLAIIAILLVMATRYYLVTSRNQQVNQAATQIGMLQGAIASWKGNNADYTNLSATQLINSGLIASSDLSGGALVSAWTQPVTINVIANGDGDTNGNYNITLTAIPTWACTNLVQKYAAISPTSSCSGDGGNSNFVFINPQ